VIYVSMSGYHEMVKGRSDVLNARVRTGIREKNKNMTPRIKTIIIAGILVGVLIFAVGYAVSVESVKYEKERLGIEYDELVRQLKEAKDDCEFVKNFANKVDYYDEKLIDLQQYYQQQNEIVKACAKISVAQKKIDEFKTTNDYP
jgi:peptidoglycan hydrolase CwlO-like protein